MTTTPAPEYTPGEWVAVVTPGRVGLLPPGTPAATVRRLWASLRDGAALVDHLQVLAAGDLTAMPPFALVTVTGARLHAVVRGAVEVRVTSAEGARLVTAPHVSTWSEEVVDDVVRVEVRAVGDDGSDVADALPVVSGVVRAGAVRVPVGTAADVAPTTTAEPAPVLAGVSVTARPGWRAAATARAGGAVTASVPSPAPAADVMLGDEPVDITLLRPARADYPAATDTDTDLAGLAGLADVAVPADVAVVAGLAPDVAGSPDHDGTTVLGHEVLALRRQLPEWTGHAVVGALVVPAPGSPASARIALSTGDVVSLSRPVLLGRAPQASRVAGPQVPRLVTVPSPLQDISRTHAEVRMDGDDVVVTDLRSTNGVLVVEPAGTPQRLQPGEATVLQPGVLVDLGEGVTFTVERGA